MSQSLADPEVPAVPLVEARPRVRGQPGGVGQSILAIVRESPGIHFRGLARAANVRSAGQLRHHIDRLRRHGMLVEMEDGGYKRFFAANDQSASVRPGMARFSRNVPRRIGRLLLTRPMNRTELRRSLGCADSTLSYHLNRMLQAGDVSKSREAHTCRYALTNHDLVRQVLLLQTEAGKEEDSPHTTSQSVHSTVDPTANHTANHTPNHSANHTSATVAAASVTVEPTQAAASPDGLPASLDGLLPAGLAAATDGLRATDPAHEDPSWQPPNRLAHALAGLQPDPAIPSAAFVRPVQEPEKNPNAPGYLDVAPDDAAQTGQTGQTGQAAPDPSGVPLAKPNAA